MWIRLLAAGKQLSVHRKIVVHNSSGVQYPNSDVEKGAMTVTDTETLEGARRGCGILDHMVPQPWVIFGTGTVPKLDTVTPYDDLPSEALLEGGRANFLRGSAFQFWHQVGG